VDRQSLINFERYKNISDSIAVILRYQEKKYNILQAHQNSGSLAYLEERLASTSIGQAAEDKLESRSLELQRQENRDYEQRTNELTAVGFRPKGKN